MEPSIKTRHTFGTMLAKAGVSLQVAQRLMRHSAPKLTANTYTHLGLLDMQGAVDKLPALESEDTHPVAAVSVAREVAPTSAPKGHLPSFSGNLEGDNPNRVTDHATGTLANKDKGCQGVAREKNGVPGRNRTRNLLVRSQTLYPIELRVRMAWCGRRKV